MNESLIKTPLRKHVGRIGSEPRVVTSGYEWKDASAVPGAILSAETERKLREQLAEIDRCQARARVSARSYVLY